MKHTHPLARSLTAAAAAGRFLPRLALGLVLVLFLAGCSTRDVDRADMDYVTDSFPIGRIGVYGQISNDASLEFIFAGYEAVDLGPDIATALDKAEQKGLRFVALVTATDVDRSHQYGMSVMDVKTGNVLWAGEGPGGNDDSLPQTRERAIMAVRAMVASFSQPYPPAGPPH